MWGDDGGRRCDVQSASTFEGPSAKIGLHRVSSLVSPFSPSPLLPLNLPIPPFSEYGNRRLTSDRKGSCTSNS